MTTDSATTKHIWISNAAFARMTGIKKVCLSCGAGSPGPNATQPCPGKRLDR